jgi:hypothetical protein
MNVGLAFLLGMAFMLLLILLAGAAIAPDRPKAPVIRYLRATPSPAKAGEAVVLCWETSEAVCAWLHEPGDQVGRRVPLRGELEVRDGAARYVLSAIGAQGQVVTDHVAVPRVHHEVHAFAWILAPLLGMGLALALGCGGQRTRELVQPRIVTFAPDLPRLTSGQGTILRWGVEGAARLVLEPGGDVTGKDSLPITPDASASYVLTAWSRDGLVDRSRADVEVVHPMLPLPQEDPR